MRFMLFSEFTPTDVAETVVQLKKKEPIREEEVIEKEIVEEVSEDVQVDISVSRVTKPESVVEVQSKEIPELEWEIGQVIEKEVTVESTGYEVEFIPAEPKPGEITVTTESIVSKPEVVEIEQQQPERQKKVEEEKRITLIQEIEEVTKRHDIIIEAKTKKGITEIRIRKVPEHADEFTVSIDDEVCREFDTVPQPKHTPSLLIPDQTALQIGDTQALESSSEHSVPQTSTKSAVIGVTPMFSASVGEVHTHDTTASLQPDTIIQQTPGRSIDTLQTIAVEEQRVHEQLTPYTTERTVTNQASSDILLQTPLLVEDTLASENTGTARAEAVVPNQANTDLIHHKALSVTQITPHDKEQGTEI